MRPDAGDPDRTAEGTAGAGGEYAADPAADGNLFPEAEFYREETDINGRVWDPDGSGDRREDAGDV